MRKPSRIASTCTAAAIAFAGVAASNGGASAATTSASNAGSVWRQTDANAALSRSNPDEHVLTAASILHARLLRTLQPQVSSPVDDQTCSYPGPAGYARSPMFQPGGRLFVGTQNSVTVYDPSTGRSQQQIALEPERNDYLSVAKGLLVANGADCDSASDPTGGTEAHDAITGQQLWFGEPAPDNDEGEVAIGTVQDGLRLFVNGTGISAIDVASGKTLWKRDGGCWPYGAQIFVAGGHLVTTNCGDAPGLTVYDEQSGRLLWTRKASFGPIRADRSTPGGRAQIYVTRANGRVAVLGANHGATLFGLKGATSVIAADRSRIYASCGTPNTDTPDICAYSKTGGALLWHATESNDEVRQYPLGYLPLVAVAGNVVYVANGDVLDAATGASITHLWTSGTATDLAVGDGYVAADLGDGTLRLYGLPGS